MERLRIDELKAQHRGPSGKCTNADIAAAVFKGDKARPVNGAKARALNPKRGENIIAAWNNGRSLTALKPRHIKRIAKFFGVTDVNTLIQAD